MIALIKQNAALIFTGFASFILMGAGQSMYGPMIPAFSRGFGVNIGTAGLMVSAHWIGCAFGVGAMFFYASRATPRHVILAMGAGAAILTFATSFALAFLGAMVFGAGYGAATVVFNPRVLRAFGAKGPAMLSLMNATFGIGAIAAPLVYVALGSKPPLTFAVCAGMGALIWLLAGAASRSEDAGAAARITAPLRIDLPILVFYGLIIALEASLSGLGPVALIAAGSGEAAAAQLLSLFFLGFMASRILLIFIAHRIPTFSIGLAALAITTLACIGAALYPPGPFFVVIGLCAGTYFPSMYVTATARMGDHPRVSPIIIGAGLIGGIFAPMVLSPLLPALGERGFFWLFAAVAGAMVAVGLAYRGRLST